MNESAMFLFYINVHVYVVVNFFISGNFCFFFLFLGMVMYANEVETREK